MLRALRETARQRSLDFSFTRAEEIPSEERYDATLFDLRNQAKLPSGAGSHHGGSIGVVLCGAEQLDLAEEAMARAEAYVILGESDESAAPQVLFTIRKALYEDDKHGTALQAARSASKRYEDLLQAIPDIVYRLDVEGNFTFVNEAIASLGYTPEELLGRHFSYILHEQDARRVSRKHVLPEYHGRQTGLEGAPGLFDERRGRERRTRGMEIRLKGGRKQGAPSSMEGLAIAYGEVSATGHYREEQSKRLFTGTVGIIRDVTWRKRSEKLLHLTSRALEQSTTGVCIFTLQGSVEFANPTYSHMLGVAHDELLQTPIKRLWDRHYRGEDFQSMMERVHDTDALQSDLRCVNSAEEEAWVSVRLQSVETGQGQTYLLLLQDDISERKEYEANLRKTANEKGLLLQEVHHRVKNNLQVISSMLSIEADQDDNPQVRSFLTASRRRIRAMALVHDALYHSDTQARLDLPSYLNQVIDGVTHSATIPVEIERDLPERYEVELSFAILFGLVVNELVSHALGLGNQWEPGERRRLSLQLEIDEQIVLRLSGSEEPITPDSSAGVLIVEALAGQLNGELTQHPGGATEFRLPSP